MKKLRSKKSKKTHGKDGEEDETPKKNPLLNTLVEGIKSQLKIPKDKSII